MYGKVTILEKLKFYKLEYINDDIIKTIETISKFNENDEVVSVKSTVKDGVVEVLLTVRHIVIGG